MMVISKIKNKKTLHKYHLTAIIDRNVTYTNNKSGKINVYTEKEHNKLLKGHDKLTDSRIIEASSLEEAKREFYATIQQEQKYGEYSSSAIIQLDNVQFIDERESDEVKKIYLEMMDYLSSPFRQDSYFDFSDKEFFNRSRDLSIQMSMKCRYSPPPKDLIFLHRKLAGIFIFLKKMNLITYYINILMLI
jgi:hypothetical protein